MANYLLTYHGGKGMRQDEAERQETMAAWGKWYQELGAAVVDGGNPTGAAMTVSNDGVSEGGGSNPVTGYSIIAAGSLAEAAEKARGCPIVDDGGSVVVSETFQVM